MMPKLYENFVSDKVVDSFLLAINNNINSFRQDGPSGKIMGYGQDNFKSSWFFDSPNKINDIFDEAKPIIRNYINKIEEIAKKDSEMDVTLSVLWFVKTISGGFPAHTDNEPDAIYKYDHTCILYLNDCADGGAIYFPDYDYKFYPQKGALLSFPSSYFHEVLAVSEPRYAMPSWFTTDKRYALL
jgi:hypothetical protein